jgi:hypothetical protein
MLANGWDSRAVATRALCCGLLCALRGVLPICAQKPKEILMHNFAHEDANAGHVAVISSRMVNRW